MAAARDVRFPVAHEVQGDAPIVAFATVAVRDVNLEGAGKVRKVARTFARPMEVGRDAHGDNLIRNLEPMIRSVTRSPEGRLGYVRVTVPWFGINGSMAVPPWEPWFTRPHPTNLKK